MCLSSFKYFAMCTKIRLQTAYCLLRGIFSFLCPLVWLFKQIFCKNFKWRLIEVDVSLKIWKLRNITWVNRGGFSIVNRVLRGGLWKIDCKWGGISLVWHNLNPRIPRCLVPLEMTVRWVEVLYSSKRNRQC